MGNKPYKKLTDYKQSPSTLSINTASLTRISILDIDVEHLETFSLVWLDRNNENEALKQRLREHVAYLIAFDDAGLCEEWLKTRPIDDKILLIVPGQLGNKIVPNIHQLTSIIGIYIFCSKLENHFTWTQNYPKIRPIIFTAEGLVQQVSRDQIYFDNIETSKATKIFNGPAHTRIFDLANTPFIYYQLLLEMLISSSYLPPRASPVELIKLFRRSCSDDQQALDLIKQFENTYSKDNALTWLINNTPLARFVNKALREQNISMLFYLRFLLIDIYNQLIKHPLPSAHVYRKQIMSLNDIENIRLNVNNYIMFNEFLYTSTKKSEGSLVDTNENQLQTVYIEIDAESRDETAPFAYIQPNDEPTNSKVLFMCGSIFKIVSLSRDTNTSCTLQLVLVGYRELNVLADKKEKLRRNKDLLMIVELLDQSNQSDKANLYCQHLLRELPANHILVPKIKEKMDTDRKTQSVALQRIQIILLDLSTRLTPYASAMLDVLNRLTNNSILICESPSEINFDGMSNKTILLFASSQARSSMTKPSSQLIQDYILEDDRYTDNEVGHFKNSEDLIFELADALGRCYKWESKDHLRAGDTTLATEQDKLAEQIDNALKKVEREFSVKGNKNEVPICTTTAIVYLKSKHNIYDKNNMAIIETLFKDIISSFETFDDVEKCFLYVWAADYSNAVFLIIDNDYTDMSVAGFQSFNNVKKIYRYQQSSSTTGKHGISYFEITQDLTSHYYRLSTEFEDRNDENNSKDMFSKTSQLCELLKTFCKP